MREQEIYKHRDYYQYEYIDDLTFLFQLDGKDYGIETLHMFAPGFYGRIMKIPKDIGFTAIRHGIKNMLSVTQGSIVFTNGYDEFKQYDAPFTITTYPGTRRAGYAVTDCTLMTVHNIEIDRNKDILKQLEAI